MRHFACRPFLLLLLSTLLLTFSAQAQAWNAAGHRLVALIAWQEMSLPARTIAGRLLDAHPDSRHWLVRGETGDAGRALFIEASTWADEIRDDPRFYDDNREASSAPIPGLVDNARHRDWHYLDLPASGDARPGDGQIDRQLLRLLGVLQSDSIAAHVHALPWIIHLVADIHQPLHVGSRGGDGGNRFRIADPAHPRLKESNLHRWWDDLPGPPWLRGERLQHAAELLMTGQPPVATATPEQWRDESRQLAHRFAYPAASDEPPALITPEFSARARDLTQQRLYAAGVRLGRLLDTLLLSVPRETHRR